MAILKYSDIADSGLFVRLSTKGQPNGVAELNGDGLVPTSQLPEGIGGVGTQGIQGIQGISGGAGSGSSAFTFRVNFSGASPASVAEVPVGWNVTLNGTTVNVSHNVNTFPKFISYLGFNTDTYRYRTPSAFDEMTFANSTKLTNFAFALTNDIAGSQQSGHAYVSVLF